MPVGGREPGAGGGATRLSACLARKGSCLALSSRATNINRRLRQVLEEGGASDDVQEDCNRPKFPIGHGVPLGQWEKLTELTAQPGSLPHRQ